MKRVAKYLAWSKLQLRNGAAEAFGLLAILFFVGSFITVPHNVQLRREVRRVERAVHQRQKVIEQYALRAINAPDDEWIDFSDLPEDMVVYKYSSGTLHSWGNKFPISNDDIEAYPYTYRLQYLSSSNLYSTPLAYIGVSEKYVNLGSSWYIMNTQISPKSNVKVVTGILVRSEYPIDGIAGSVNRRLHLNDDFTTVDVNEDCAGVVYGREGSPLFSIVAKSYGSYSGNGRILLWISFLFAAVAFVLLHYRKCSILSFGLLFAGLVLIRFAAAMAAMDGSSEIFSPSLYAGSATFDSLASLLLNNLLVSLLVFGFFMLRYKVFRRIETGYKRFRHSAIWMTGLFSVVLFAYIHLTLRSLLLNSSIVLEPFMIASLNLYSILCFFSYAMLFLALLYTVQLFVVFLMRGTKRVTLFSWKNVLRYIIAVSAYFLICVNVFSVEKEFENNKIISGKLALDRDLQTEMRLRSIDRQILNDPFIALLVSEPDVDGLALVKNRLQELYIGDVAQQYSVTLTKCSSNDFLSVGSSAEPVPCYDFYSDKVNKYGAPLTPESNFFHIRDYEGKISYLGIFTYFNQETYDVSWLFIELQQRFQTGGIGYPLYLWNSGQNNSRVLPPQYSFARYMDGRLVSCGGTYEYPTEVPERYSNGYMMEKQNGQVHFINSLQEGNVVVISRSGRALFQYVVSFSYLFIFFGLFILLMTSRGRTNRLLQLPKHSIKRKITLITTGVMVAALLALGFAGIIYRTSTVETVNRSAMEEQINSVQTTLSSYCRYAMRYNEINTPELFAAMNEVASITRSDINVFSTEGSLIRSTRPEIFELYLDGARMDADAFYNITKKHANRYINIEKIAGASFYSIYAPLFNSDGMMVAIVNVPYFSKSTNVNERTSSTMATVLNISLVLLIAALVLGVLLSNSMTRPLDAIRKRIETLSMSSDADQHIHYKNSNDELGVLIRAYNTMVDDLEKSTRQLAQQEREQAWREMARQIAHEIKNPLTPMRLSIEYLMKLKARNAQGWEEKFDSIGRSLLEQIDILAETASEFSSFAKFFNEEPVEVDIDYLMKEQVIMFDNRENITVKYECTLDSPVVVARSKQISRVFLNIITNAVQAIEGSRGSGIVNIIIDNAQSPYSGKYRIVIEDNGPGVSEQNLKNLFVPNFTTKTSGTGLGLAICKSIIEQSRGTIEYAPSRLGGAAFIIELPAKGF